MRFTNECLPSNNCLLQANGAVGIPSVLNVPAAIKQFIGNLGPGPFLRVALMQFKDPQPNSIRVCRTGWAAILDGGLRHRSRNRAIVSLSSPLMVLNSWIMDFHLRSPSGRSHVWESGVRHSRERESSITHAQEPPRKALAPMCPMQPIQLETRFFPSFKSRHYGQVPPWLDC